MITDGTTDVYFFSILGQPLGLGMMLADEHRPGEDGSAFRQMGNEPSPFKLVCECHVDTYPAAHTLGILLHGLKGHIIDFTQADQDNTDCLLMGILIPDAEMAANIRRGVYPADGSPKNGAGAIFRCELELLYAGNS